MARNGLLQREERLPDRRHRFRRHLLDREAPAMLSEHQKYLSADTTEERKGDCGEIRGVDAELGEWEGAIGII